MMKWKNLFMKADNSFLKLFIFLLIPVATMFISATSLAAEKKPKLVLQITVDQLRGDLPYRYQDRFVDNGFKYLFNNGVVYKDAHHQHANTETVVGHVTLATGAYPSSHGLIANVWYDQKAGHTVYNVEDGRYPLLDKNAVVDKKTEIDPTQKAASSDGRSPNSISSSTFSDELLIATNGKAKVFGVSVKDRGAISMAGHGGKAFWFSKATQEFVTSQYYYQQYPNWVTAWNEKKYPAEYKDTQWALLHDKSTYVFGDDDDKAWEMDLAGFGKTFPHSFGHSKYFSTMLTFSPYGDELTAKFAKELVKQENLGQDNITDYLSVSFSATDYIGHAFGAASLETEDNLLRLDRTLADLFSYIDKTVGLDNTLIVLSADHGSPDIPTYLAHMNLQGEHVLKKDWDKEPVVVALKKELGISERLIEAYYQPYVYLDKATLAKHKLGLPEAQILVADAIAKHEDVDKAIASTRIEQNQLANTRVNRLVENNYFPSRSGDIYLVFKPQEFINDLEGLKVPSVHGSAWSYDTFVPVIFAGAGIKAKTVYRPIETVDVAPTLSLFLNIKPPSATDGKVLGEVFK